MRLLVIFCHPSSESYGAALYDLACRTLRAAGHELRCHDLYRERFDPVLSEEEWRLYLPATQTIIDKHPDHVADLLWAEGLVVIYPTWYYGAPAMLKGWLERVWLPGVTFEVSDGKQHRPKPMMRQIRLFVGITTSGSPWWWIKLPRPRPQPLDPRPARAVPPALQGRVAPALQHEPHHGRRPLCLSCKGGTQAESLVRPVP